MKEVICGGNHFLLNAFMGIWRTRELQQQYEQEHPAIWEDNSTRNCAVPGQRAEVDRSINIVVFGIAEDRNAAVWRQSVQNALDHVSGQHVDIVDLHRVGRYDQNKMRPIVVKLRSGWDRRILLSRRSTLRTYPDRVFLAPDESLDVRRQHTLDRLKARAERAGQSVSVSDGILSVDGVEVFSLSNGHANRHG